MKKIKSSIIILINLPKIIFFNKIVFIYNAKENTWKNAGELPDAGTAGSSSVMENNFLMLINGELKPGYVPM